jgi:hypothetical protein
MKMSALQKVKDRRKKAESTLKQNLTSDLNKSEKNATSDGESVSKLQVAKKVLKKVAKKLTSK